MAVQKSRKSRAKRGMRNAHRALVGAALSVDITSGEKHRRHHITSQSYYRGKPVGDANQSNEN